MSQPPLTDRIALVTGASRGIGHASALALAKAGAHVVAVARTQGALEALDDEIKAATGQSATLVPMDIAEHDGLDQLGLALHQRFGRLDILVPRRRHARADDPGGAHRAEALGQGRRAEPDRLLPPDPAVEDLLRASDRPRAIFLTSGRASRPKAFWGPYGVTKAGLEHMVRTWADELEKTSVRAVLLDPSVMRTRMRAEAMPGEDPATLPDPSGDRPAGRRTGPGRPGQAGR
jgi:NAD(P)-dependent dehydrogenase (short-subunit alcohol dehydrogenase family)